MSNEYYDHTTYPSIGAPGSSSALRAELNLIEAGFDKLPVMTGNGNKIVVINAGGTAMSASGAGLDNLSDVVITAAVNKHLLQHNGTNWVNILGPTGAIVGISDTQTLTNKTISGASNTLSNIGNSSLTNSSLTIGSTNIALGATSTTLTGLSSVTSTAFAGALNGSVGGVTPAAGAFTTLAASGAFSLSGDTVQISEGGTGAATAAAARVALLPAIAGGAGKVLAVNVGETDYELVTVAGTGTVTSVSGTGTVNGLTLTGTVTAAGSLTLGGTLSGVDLTTAVTGVLPAANGGTGVSSLPSGSLVGTTATQTLTNKTINGSSNTISNVSLSTGVTGTLPVANGGTGQTTAAAALTALGGIAAAGGDVTGALYQTPTSFTTSITVTDNNVFLRTGVTSSFTLSFAGSPTAGKVYAFSVIVAVSSGTPTITWPAAVDWEANQASPGTLSTGEWKFDFYTRDGGTTYRGTWGEW